MMHDPIKIPACFTSATRPVDETAVITRSGQSLLLSVYETSIAGQCHMITISWYKNFLLHGFTVTIVGTEGITLNCFEVELKPGFFWRKQGLKHISLDGWTIGVAWDLTAAKFSGQTEPQSNYYVAILFDEEIVLLIGDMKKDAFRRTGCRPALLEPILISKREHIFGKRKFSTRFKFHEKGYLHDITIECNNRTTSHNFNGESDQEMEIKLDGNLLVLVKHLQWNFRGNALIGLNKTRVELCWDVHDWLFHPGLRHAVFTLKSAPILSISTSATMQPHSPLLSLTPEQLSFQAANAKLGEEYEEYGSSGFFLSIYAWKFD